MIGIVISVRSALSMFHGIVLTTAKIRCGFCNLISSHGFGSRTSVVNESRSCHHCHKENRIDF